MSTGSTERWTEQQAQQWHQQIGWLAGCNFTPSTACNQLELWQAETFDAVTIDRELGWAAELGFNAMRVFLHDALWANEGQAYLDRVDSFLDIAWGHGIAIMPVLFDGVWHPEPKLGPQKDPIPGVHNSRWVQGPGAEILMDEQRWESLRPYVDATIGRFAEDERVVVWDLFNEPAQRDRLHWSGQDLIDKSEAACGLVAQVFEWGRAIRPTQPLTVGLYGVIGDAEDAAAGINAVAAAESDVISFHSYEPADAVAATIDQLSAHGRPMICTEWLARSEGSTVDVLQVFADADVSAFTWGFVDGRTQTRWPWTSWREAGGPDDPWFHELLHGDGTPYDEAEAETIRRVTAAKLGG